MCSRWPSSIERLSIPTSMSLKGVSKSIKALVVERLSSYPCGSIGTVRHLCWGRSSCPSRDLLLFDNLLQRRLFRPLIRGDYSLSLAGHQSPCIERNAFLAAPSTGESTVGPTGYSLPSINLSKTMSIVGSWHHHKGWIATAILSVAPKECMVPRDAFTVTAPIISLMWYLRMPFGN